MTDNDSPNAANCVARFFSRSFATTTRLPIGAAPTCATMSSTNTLMVAALKGELRRESSWTQERKAESGSLFSRWRNSTKLSRQPKEHRERRVDRIGWRCGLLLAQILVTV
ncbi:uncharacterized protein LOC108093386 [Drosophila ficusphila]|uniref:uncharacterized protein LOC108093386 n=1 Tax=Drosophila ficusphila TaxID=30025 RepID=UPI0007E79843|nr:uncharacterized protein LOC108093386 [Drosophila ficusphila]